VEKRNPSEPGPAADSTRAVLEELVETHQDDDEQCCHLQYEKEYRM
jgi:hypothetical protein